MTRNLWGALTKQERELFWLLTEPKLVGEFG